MECKNWSKPVDVRELPIFLQKLENRNGRCQLGFFVALGGFTGPFKDDLRAHREDSFFIVVLGQEELRG